MTLGVLLLNTSRNKGKKHLIMYFRRKLFKLLNDLEGMLQGREVLSKSMLQSYTNSTCNTVLQDCCSAKLDTVSISHRLFKDATTIY